jgi:putative hemolysin
MSAGKYLVRFARTEAYLDRILRLRYQIYNLELAAGLESANLSQRDEDRFDRQFHHLLIEERESGEVVGTYRMQTCEMANAGGYSSERLFEVESLPDITRKRAIELGRVAIARQHRNGRVLHLLWRGLANYLAWNRKSVLFGCCSLTSQDQGLALAVHRHLARLGAQHATIAVAPRSAAACQAPEPDLEHAPAASPKIPALFQAYLTMGARVLGAPAIDREFRSLDWLVLLDVEELDRFTYSTFFK